MSIDFVAILGHSLDNSRIVSLPNRLNSEPNIGIAAARFCQFLTRKRWLLSADDLWYWEAGYDLKWEGTDPNDIWDADIVLQGPCILRLHFGRSALYLFAPLRFSTFTDDAEVQAETRCICFALGRALGGNEAIYLPDSGPWKVQLALDLIWESYSLAQIREWLSQNIGLPSANIHDVDTVLRKDDVLGGYYIDDFEDMQSVSAQSNL